jgi:hypothetical protein
LAKKPNEEKQMINLFSFKSSRNCLSGKENVVEADLIYNERVFDSIDNIFDFFGNKNENETLIKAESVK